jgi:hypothetical protein
MSDFDAVLERLLTDPAFRAALAADPESALAGLSLSDDERDLLYAQVSTDAGGERQVEQRTSKAGLFGLLSPLAEAVGLTPDTGIGHAAGAAAAAHTNAGGGVGASQGFGPAAPTQGFGPAGHGDRLGIGRAISALAGGSPDPDDVNGIVGDGGRAMHDGATAGFGEAPNPPPADYHPNVDVDGDGRWDAYTVQARADGGIDVIADSDHDGRPDFVGHDDNRDGIIDRADYDNDRDGRFESHLIDSNGDGWMDRTVVDPPGR